MPPLDQVAELSRWIMAEPHRAHDSTAFVTALAERLTLEGVPLWRLRYALLTMVLKFIGDAVLAIFPQGSDPRAACRRALAAAEQAFTALASVSEPPSARAAAALEIGVGLHCGPVMYGNIGARNRLDFTVISSAVNEASRLESLCKPLGVRLTLSAVFVETAQIQAQALDLGEQTLKGVRAPLRVFTVRGQ